MAPDQKFRRNVLFPDSVERVIEAGLNFVKFIAPVLLSVFCGSRAEVSQQCFVS